MKKLTYKQILEKLLVAKKENERLKKVVNDCHNTLAEGQKFLNETERTFEAFKKENSRLEEKECELERLKEKLIDEYFLNTELERTTKEVTLREKKFIIKFAGHIADLIPEAINFFTKEEKPINEMNNNNCNEKEI